MPKPIDRFLHTFKLVKNISAIGGGAIGVSLAALGATSAAGAMAGALTTSAVIVGTGGLALLTLPVAYAIARATFWRKDRQKIAGEKKRLTNNDFNNPMDWDCYWATTVVIGYDGTGKTQLKKRLQGYTSLRDTKPGSTDELEIHLCLLDSEKKVYIALLDSKGARDGKSVLQDHLIGIAIEKAQWIILVLDHADTRKYGGDADLNTQRLKVQEDFIKSSVIDRIKRQDKSNSPIKGIIVVMNKADVWENKESKDHIQKWTQEQADKLKDELKYTVQTFYLSAEDSDHPAFHLFKNELAAYVRQNQ